MTTVNHIVNVFSALIVDGSTFNDGRTRAHVCSSVQCSRRFYIDSAVDIQVVHGRWWFLFYERLVCVPGASDVRIKVAAILEKLTLKSPDEIDTAVRNPDTGSTRVRTNSEHANEVYGKLEIAGTPASSRARGHPRA